MNSTVFLSFHSLDALHSAEVCRLPVWEDMYYKTTALPPNFRVTIASRAQHIAFPELPICTALLDAWGNTGTPSPCPSRARGLSSVFMAFAVLSSVCEIVVRMFHKFTSDHVSTPLDVQNGWVAELLFELVGKKRRTPWTRCPSQTRACQCLREASTQT